MPAHFTSDDERGRTQTFCVDYDIPADHEASMASTAWNAMGEFVPRGFDFEGNSYSAYVLVAENLMLGAYILAKEGRSDLLPELRAEIIKNALEDFSPSFPKFKETLSLDFVDKFLNHCIEIAGRVATEK
jgi:hypothetical protein